MANQDGFQARGQDVLVRLKVDGAVQNYDFPSVEIDWGLDVGTSEYVGDTTQRPYGQNRACRLRFTAEPKHKGLADLFMAQRQANGPNKTRKVIQIDVTCTTDYGPGGLSRVAFNGCTLSGATQANGAPADKVRKTFELSCPEPKKI